MKEFFIPSAAPKVNRSSGSKYGSAEPDINSIIMEARKYKEMLDKEQPRLLKHLLHPLPLQKKVFVWINLYFYQQSKFNSYFWSTGFQKQLETRSLQPSSLSVCYTSMYMHWSLLKLSSHISISWMIFPTLCLETTAKWWFPDGENSSQKINTFRFPFQG